MNDIYIDPNCSMIQTSETGWIGHCGFPGQGYYRSINDNIQITINDGLSIAGRAQALSHELYGHGYLYMSTKGNYLLSTHQFGAIGVNTRKDKDINIRLNYRIKLAINETVNNMR